jgi:hypothetical protein
VNRREKQSFLYGLLVASGECAAVNGQQLFSQADCFLPIRTISSRPPAALDSRLQAAKEFLAQFAAFQVGFDFFTGKVLQLTV